MYITLFNENTYERYMSGRSMSGVTTFKESWSILLLQVKEYSIKHFINKYIQ